MKFQVIIFLMCWIVLPCLAQEKPISRVKVKITKNEEVVALMDLPSGKIQVQAKNISYDKPSGAFILSNGCAITVIQNKEHSLRFEGNEARVEARQIELQVYGGYPIDYPNFPLEALSDALKNNPNLSLFRLSWGFSMGSWGIGGSSLYDKENQTLREYATGGDEMSGYRNRFLYTDVTENMVHKMADEGKKQGRGGFTGPLSFNALTQYGALREGIK